MECTPMCRVRGEERQGEEEETGNDYVLENESSLSAERIETKMADEMRQEKVFCSDQSWACGQISCCRRHECSMAARRARSLEWRR